MLRLLCFCFVATVGVLPAAGWAMSDCSRPALSGVNQALPSTRINQSLLDAAILGEVNFARCKNGLSALAGEPKLRKTAEGHTKWMAKARKVTHKSTVSGRRSVLERLKRSGVSFRAGSENISMLHYYQVDGRSFLTRDAAACKFTMRDGTPLPRHSYASLARAAVGYWMASKLHRANILDRKVTMMGSAASVDPKAEFCGTVYLTQNFAG